MKQAVILAIFALLAGITIAQNCKADGKQCSDMATEPSEKSNAEPDSKTVQKQESQPIGVEDDYVQQKCEFFDKSKFGPNNASIFVVEAKGRLGNHLIAYAMVIALAKEMGVVPMVVGETHRFIHKYFENITVGAFEYAFCNFDSMPILEFEGTVKELEAASNLRNGLVINLWPRGYQKHVTVCCPSQDLTTYVKDNLSNQELKEIFRFRPKFAQHAADLRRKAADRKGVPVDDVTFVGIHNRRTDYIHYMEVTYGLKNPYTKKYFYEAMDYFREEHENVIFFYVSDDMEWGKKNIKNKNKDIYFVGKGEDASTRVSDRSLNADAESVGLDLAVLSSCNHSITTWGTFGMWAALLSGGEYYSQYGVIVPGDIQNISKEEQRNKKMKKKMSEKEEL